MKKIHRHLFRSIVNEPSVVNKKDFLITPCCKRYGCQRRNFLKTKDIFFLIQSSCYLSVYDRHLVLLHCLWYYRTDYEKFNTIRSDIQGDISPSFSMSQKCLNESAFVTKAIENPVKSRQKTESNQKNISLIMPDEERRVILPLLLRK